jgi:hypothetical protein
LPAPRRRKNSREVETGLTWDMACREARRCLRCDLETQDGKDALKVLRQHILKPAEPGEAES